MSRYLITGAGGGMGCAVRNALLQAGHEVWGIDRKEMAEETGFHPATADLCSTEELKKLSRKIREEAGELDGIIHTAGIYDLGALAEMPETEFVLDFDVNVFGAFRVNKLFLPMLKTGGRIVIITSELVPLHPLPFTGIYAVTKTALDQYAAALRMETQLLGYPVIVIRPGAVKTDMLPESCRKLNEFCDKTKIYTTNAERFRKIVNRVEARSIPPEKIADVITKALNARRPKPVYNINRNPMLLMLNALPLRLQLWIIRRILKQRIRRNKRHL